MNGTFWTLYLPTVVIVGAGFYLGWKLGDLLRLLYRRWACRRELRRNVSLQIEQQWANIERLRRAHLESAATAQDKRYRPGVH